MRKGEKKKRKREKKAIFILLGKEDHRQVLISTFWFHCTVEHFVLLKHINSKSLLYINFFNANIHIQEKNLQFYPCTCKISFYISTEIQKTRKKNVLKVALHEINILLKYSLLLFCVFEQSLVAV